MNSNSGKDKGSLITEDSLYPAIYHTADLNSLSGQRRFVWATRVRLFALVAAAALGAVSLRISGSDLAAVTAAALFGVALFAEIYIFRESPERQWFEGRVAAESAKTLTWRFAVGGAPMPLVSGDEGGTQAGEVLLDRFREIVRHTKGAYLVPVAPGVPQVTDEMLRIRNLSLDERREAYRVYRIEDQRSWYEQKAAWNGRRANMWAIGLTVAEAFGLAGGIVRAAGWISIDLLGIASAIVAAGVAWTQMKQYQNLANAYAIAAMELADIAFRMRRPCSEADWAHFVDQAEEAISREHTLWRASHS
jgi:hypothetical protein